MKQYTFTHIHMITAVQGVHNKHKKHKQVQYLKLQKNNDTKIFEIYKIMIP